jgi:hypothetical protein
MENQRVAQTYAKMGALKDAMSILFLQDDDVRNLVMPKLDDENFSVEDNWYGGVVTDRRGTTKTLIGHCFDVPFVSDTITDNRTIICMESYMPYFNSKATQEITLMVNIFANKDGITYYSKEDKRMLNKMRARGYTGNRIDMLVMAICNAVNSHDQIHGHEQDYSIGSMLFQQKNPVVPYQPNSVFYGKQIFFDVYDFSMTSRNLKG